MPRTPSGALGAPESALARLLAIEERIEALLATARRDADAVREAARAQVAARLDALAAELTAADAALGATLAREAESRIFAERAALDRRIGRYEALDDARVEELAAWLADEVLSGVPTGGAR